MFKCLGKKNKKKGRDGEFLRGTFGSKDKNKKTLVNWDNLRPKLGINMSKFEQESELKNPHMANLPKDAIRMMCRFSFLKLLDEEIDIKNAFTEVLVSEYEYDNSSDDMIEAFCCDDPSNSGKLFRNYLARIGTPQSLRGFSTLEKSMILKLLPDDHFCIRLASSNNRSDSQPFSVTYNSRSIGRPTNYQVFKTHNGKYCFRSLIFNELEDIVDHIMQTDKLQPYEDPPPINKPREISTQNLEIVRNLGSGNFGSVDECLMRHPGVKEGGIHVAVKKLKFKAGIPKDQLEAEKKNFRDEMIIHNFIFHSSTGGNSYCVELIAVHKGDPLMMVLELCTGGSAKEMYEERVKKNEICCHKIAIRFIICILGAVIELILIRIGHFDVACRNIFIFVRVTIGYIFKIGDFGLSRYISDGTESQSFLALLPVYDPNERVAIPLRWAAPEQIADRHNVDVECNTFCACITIFEFVTGRVPWDGDDRQKVRTNHMDYENYYDEYMDVCYHPLPSGEQLHPQLTSIIKSGILPSKHRATGRSILTRITNFSLEGEDTAAYSQKAPT